MIADPTVNPDHDRRRGKYFLIAFLVIGWVASASLAADRFFGDNAGRLANLLSVATYPIFLIGAVWFYERSRRVAVPTWSLYGWAFGTLWLLLCLYGIFIGNALRVIALDSLTFSTLLAAFYLGRRDEVWEDSRHAVIALTGLSIFLALWFTDSYVLIDRGLLNEEVGSQFETGLVLAPLFCLAAATDRKLWRYSSLLALSGGCLFTYLYFGRRGVSARVALEIVGAAIILPMLSGKKRRAGVAAAVVLSFSIGLWLYFPFKTLLGRFQGQYGVVDTLTSGNERMIESSLLRAEFSEWEAIFGRGAGGAFLIDQPHSFVLDKIDELRVGRIVPHAGAWLPFLKGGVLLQSLYFLPLLILLLGVFRWPSLDPITRAALFAGALMLPFQLVEGSPTYSTPWVAFAIGLTMSRAQNLRSARGEQRATLRPSILRAR